MNIEKLDAGVNFIRIGDRFEKFVKNVMSELIHPMTASHRMNVENLPAGMYFIRIGT